MQDRGYLPGRAEGRSEKMDISTYDEVPKDEKQYSNWLSLPEILGNHKSEIESFVECYLLFFGTAGKCYRCVARELCLRLNKEDC